MKSFYFGYDLDNIKMVMDYVEDNYDESKYKFYIGYGDDIMNGMDIDSDLYEKDDRLKELIDNCDGKGDFED